MKKILSVLFLFVLGIQFSQAQTFTPDRPGIGNGSSITPESMLGLETGISYSFTSFIQQINIGQLLLRYGISEKLEFRLNLGSFSSGDQSLLGGTRNINGFQDMGVGVKYNVFSDEGKTNISALANLSLPVGDDAFSSEEFVPFVGLLADFSLQKMWSASSNFGYSFGPGDVGDYLLFTLTPGFVISDNIGGFFGYAGQYYGNSIHQNWIEGGFTFSVNNGAQLDLNLGFETVGESGFIGIGFAKAF